MAYNDIDSNKVLNKEGLLELSGQIKGYINTNIPSPYTLPAASTSTLGGVKVDGETIVIDQNNVISAAGGGSGGGASYTAGPGITIDANNEIGLQFAPFLNPWWTFFDDGGLISGNELFKLDTPSTKSTVEDFCNDLKIYGYAKTLSTNHSITPKAINEYLGTSYDFYTILVNTNNGTITKGSLGPTGTTKLGKLNKTYYHLFLKNCVCSFENAAAVRNLIGMMLAWNINVPSTNKNSYTSFRLKPVIEEMDATIGNIITRIPVAPDTDGTYTLQCVVSSGTPTYSWVSAST